VEAVVLREGAAAAHLIAETVVVRATNSEEARCHLSRVPARWAGAKEDQANLTPRKSRHSKRVATANTKPQEVLVNSTDKEWGQYEDPRASGSAEPKPKRS
jgi:hypothetical protein